LNLLDGVSWCVVPGPRAIQTLPPSERSLHVSSFSVPAGAVPIPVEPVFYRREAFGGVVKDRVTSLLTP